MSAKSSASVIGGVAKPKMPSSGGLAFFSAGQKGAKSSGGRPGRAEQASAKRGTANRSKGKGRGPGRGRGRRQPSPEVVEEIDEVSDVANLDSLDYEDEGEAGGAGESSGDEVFSDDAQIATYY